MRQPPQKKLSARLLKIFLIVVALVFLGFGLLMLYVHQQEKHIVAEIKAKMQQSVNGELQMGAMETTLLRRFPHVAVSIKDVVLRDTLWHTHKQDFINAQQVYVSINLLSLLNKKVALKEIFISQGAINIYTNDSGYSNTSVLAAKRDTTKGKKETEVSQLRLEEVTISFINKPKFKHFNILLHSLVAKVHNQQDGFDGKVSLDAKINEFNFNITKGSYLKNKRLSATLKVSFDKLKKHLQIPLQRIKIDEQPLQLGANFYFDKTPAQFAIVLQSDAMQFKNAVAYLSPNISRHLKPFDFEKPIEVKAQVSGEMRFRSIPHVQVQFAIAGNKMITPAGNIDDVSFKGSFDNVAIPAQPPSDPNTLISIFALKGKFQTIPFAVDTLLALNLIQPKIKTHLTAQFEAQNLNNLLENTPFTVGNKGNVNIDLRYEGGASPKDTLSPHLNGYATIQNAELIYGRRNFKFSKVNAQLLFRDADILFKNISLRTASSNIALNGVAKNFLNLYYTDPAAVSIDFDMQSAQINISEFLSGLKVNNKVSKTTAKRNKTMDYADRINNALNAGTVRLNAQIQNLLYKNFKATNVKGNAHFAGNDIVLNNFSFNAASGTMKVNGKLTDNGLQNALIANANINKANAQQVFRSFDNFGMQSLTDKNLSGLLSADIAINGALREDGSFIGKSMNGTMKLKLEHGRLQNFEPIQKIGQMVFRNRNVADIQFKPIVHNFTLKNGTIYIKPLLIESSVLYINLQGQYNVKQGTDLAVAIPLRNPKRDDFNPLSLDKVGDFRKGLVINLRAQDDANGKLNITWDPRRKGGGVYSDNPDNANATTTAASNSTTDTTKNNKGFLRKIFK